jgi:hypothetical protein
MDWVRHRSECTSTRVITGLKEGAKLDVEARNKLLKAQDEMRFEVRDGSDLDSFSILRHSSRSDSVYFYVEDDGVSVMKGRDRSFHGSITLNDAGECRLRVKDKDKEIELEFWQFRRRALEELFQF